MPSRVTSIITVPVQVSWLESTNCRKLLVYINTSPYVWTYNDIGIACLENMFDCCTKKKARIRRRLSIVDSNDSYLMMDLVKNCDDKKMIVAVEIAFISINAETYCGTTFCFNSSPLLKLTYSNHLTLTVSSPYFHNNKRSRRRVTSHYTFP